MQYGSPEQVQTYNPPQSKNKYEPRVVSWNSQTVRNQENELLLEGSNDNDDERSKDKDDEESDRSEQPPAIKEDTKGTKKEE